MSLYSLIPPPHPTTPFLLHSFIQSNGMVQHPLTHHAPSYHRALAPAVSTAWWSLLSLHYLVNFQTALS